ncbi:aconitate hydratase [Entophlyctis helioformis]|nr:aconitate hydratase [Entophlyctis helioformis]
MQRKSGQKFVSVTINFGMVQVHRLLGARSLATHASVRQRLVPDYSARIRSLDRAWSKLQRPSLTLTEKILHSHASSAFDEAPVRGSTYLKLTPDRVAMQDASAQTAILQFMLAKRPSAAVPSSIHCDHLIQAYLGGNEDVQRAEKSEGEIFAFLQSAARKYGMDFWRPGSGIIHQIVLEQYAFPGGLMLGTDSHTPNAGGLGIIAIGVGGADAVDAMAGIPWELKAPKVLGVKLTGKLGGWASPKDVILRLAGELTVQGATNHIVEYFGPGVETLSCTGMATICNMGAEVGATSSVFPYTASMHRFLEATGRGDIASRADTAKHDGYLVPDAGAQYDRVIEIDLSTIEPHLNGPFTPDRSWPISKFKEAVIENGWPENVSGALIGSCTNSSYEDMTRAASIAKQALAAGIKAKTNFLITPGSEQIKATIERDNLLTTLEQAGGKVLANACGPCIGQWKRTDAAGDAPNAIVTSYNRNFARRNDGKATTMNFLASPEIVTAIAFSGKLGFNPLVDTIKDENGREFRFSPPSGIELPEGGYETRSMERYVEASTPDATQSIDVDIKSSRLQLIAPFPAWNKAEISDAHLLVKVSGKCTTDHISAAGPWLKYKGHLENISKNTLIGATNAFTGVVNSTNNALTNETGTIPDVAFAYKMRGSAREHAAMQPRFLGCVAIICRSFARIHETNLKKQGILPFTFKNPDDYDRIPAHATFSTVGLTSLAPGSPVSLVVRPRDGGEFQIELAHTFSSDQIGWFKAGSALNVIASQES